MYQAALARGHRVIADSYYAADLIVSRHGAQPEQIAALARSIDTGRFEPSAVSAERVAVLRHAWGIRPGWRVVLVPGALRPANGQMNVVDAVRILVNGGLRGVAFVIAGDGAVDEDYARAIGERVEAQGIGGLVRLAGYCPDMPAAYVIADSVIVPSLGPSTFEPVAVEAHAMGRPVIASSIGSLPEIVLAPPHVDEEDRTGWLVTPNDPVDLARALAAVLALDPALHTAIGERARSLAEMRFSPARVAEATLDLYASLLEGEG
jgi:glycosyltransferase involved in cell wall biosynthesis